MLEHMATIAAQTAVDRMLAEMEQTSGIEATAAMAKGFITAAALWLEANTSPTDAYNHAQRVADDIGGRIVGPRISL